VSKTLDQRQKGDVSAGARELDLLREQVALRDVQIQAATARLGSVRGHHELLVVQLRDRLAALRAERDDLLRSTRMLQHKLRELQTAVHEVSEWRASVATKSPLPSQLAQLRVASIMDEFTHSTLAPSCRLLQVGLVDWEPALAAFEPQVLLVESAWHGNGGQWTRKINHPSRELIELVDWCRNRGVPTVFWNKEDPVHFETFINAARLFDHVFTTDLDCIARYKALLDHERVYLMPFWGQPRLHNPVEKYARKAAFCFAGAYYARYPERQRNFDTILDTAMRLGSVEIFDRNFGKDDPNYMFPERYRALVHGTLAYDEIDRAYSGYRFGINLNSVKQSQSMFARRVFDLMLSNTHVVGNYSRGVRLLFGDLTISSDSARELSRRLTPLMGESEEAIHRRHQQRLLALRKVMLEHTAEDRLAYLMTKISGRPVTRDLPDVMVVGVAGDDGQFERLLAGYDRQEWQAKRLTVVCRPGFAPRASPGRRDVNLVRWSDARVFAPETQWPSGLVAFFSASDYYAPSYLTDAALAFLYSRAEVVGKATWYEDDGAKVHKHGEGNQYRWQESMALCRAIVAPSALAGSPLSDWLHDLERRRIHAEPCLGIDEFGYIANATADRLGIVSEPSLDTGLPVDKILCRAEDIRSLSPNVTFDVGLDATELAALFGAERKEGGLHLSFDKETMLLASSLEDEQHRYLYARRLLEPKELGGESGEITCNLVATAGLHLDLALIFLAADGERLGQAVKSFGRNHTFAVPEGTASIRFGLRVLGPGNARLYGVSTHAMPEATQISPQLGRARHLVLTNVYPSAEHLYRNAFVHRRVSGYRKAGVDTDVFVLNPRTRPNTYEFEGVDVNVGGTDQLRSLLDTNAYDTVLVHFLDSTMWSVLRAWLPNTRIIVWVHGAEIQPWHRRLFNYADDAEIERARSESDARGVLWHEIFPDPHPNLHFVFVSNYFAEEVMTDYSVQLPTSSYSVIHNVVDADLFPYRQKPQSQRMKLLSIRPYASAKYANDLTVRAIELLKEKPWFPDLKFHLVGTGSLFEETVAPLRDMPNVELDPRFLTQSEIARLHADYGVFLVPTRMDSQGVSRDEAMASGLVPITNRTAAIPEFVDDSCGFMVPEEDAQGIADAIERLVEDPALFSRMSAAAAARPRRQSAAPMTIGREIQLILGTNTPEMANLGG
jgi:glycosyltransferase involved in cell wall biosynthesis/spore maturation protein CgeB